MPRVAAYGPEYAPLPGEGDVVPRFGADPSWSPACERSDPITCRRCGGEGLVFDATDPSAALPIPFAFDPERHAIVTYDDDPIDRPGKTRFCPACGRSGRDAIIARQRERSADPAA
jgi:hypothetical protein